MAIGENAGAGKPRWWLAVLGFAILIAGAFLAQQIRTSDGTTMRDVRFTGTDGKEMSALLYVPKNATAETPAPGILAVHGYINSRETQDGFAIEFARRGYVVLSLDQTGHGYSDGPAFSNGFGGADGLRYLRSLPMVDTDQIGLEGHSMGGWTVLAAAAEMPDGYASMVLEGSSTGAPFAEEGTPDWPRNAALVFSKYDEFSSLMWGVDRAQDVGDSAKLQALFGAEGMVAEAQIYGSIADGTARILHQPATTHPGDHISPAAIGHATDWFAATLEGGTPRPASDQIWYWKEIGTGAGLVGFLLILLGAFDALIRLRIFAPLRAQPSAASDRRDRQWWRGFALNIFVPALLFFPAFIAAFLLLPASTWLPQAITSQVTLWALIVAGAGLLLSRFGSGVAAARTMRKSLAPPGWLRALALAAATAAAGYGALWITDWLFQTDIRFWIVAVKLPSTHQLAIAGIYIVPLCLAFLWTAKSVCDATVRGDTPLMRYGAAIVSLTGGLLIMLTVIYGMLFATGALITSFDPLSTVVALQFVPVLAAAAIIITFTWSRTNSAIPAGLLTGILVTLYVVAGTATQV